MNSLVLFWVNSTQAYSCFPLIRNVSCSVKVIPLLSLGLSISSPYLPPERLDSFMRRMLTSRISRRVLAEQHVALSRQFSTQSTGPHRESEEPQVGIICTGLNVKSSVERCAQLLRGRPLDVEGIGSQAPDNIDTGWPRVFVDGHTGTSLPYIREHLEQV